MKTISISDETARRLRIFIASENLGKTHGKIGATAEKAINHYIYEKEKYIDDLARKAMGNIDPLYEPEDPNYPEHAIPALPDPPSEYN